MTRKEIYKDIRRIALGEGAEGEPMFSSVAWWNKNIEFLEEDTPFDFPALFVEFGTVEYAPQKSGDRDMGQCDVLLHVVVDGHESDLFGFIDSLDRCERLISALRASPWYLRRLQSVSNHDHGEIIEFLEVVKARIF